MLTAIIFDWGDTVMRNFPGASGPMAFWPRVEAVAGVAAAVEALSRSYVLAIGSNAGESDADLVRAALERVDLAHYFDHIFTSRDLGCAKPKEEFFRAVLKALDCRPDEAVMVGDSYEIDILGAHAAGLRTVWYNPYGRRLRDSVADREIRRMADLERVIAELEAAALGERL